LLWVRTYLSSWALSYKRCICDGFCAHLLTIIETVGQLNQTELSSRIDSFLITPTGEIEHLHNQLIAAIYGNVTREMPDHGVASWVSANDKPTTGAGSKPVSGDAAEQRLKTEVMALPSRDRRRIKDLSLNEVRLIEILNLDASAVTNTLQFDPQEALASMFAESRRHKPAKPIDLAPASAGGLHKTSESRFWTAARAIAKQIFRLRARNPKKICSAFGF
jgi:transcriptional coactivator HFI1/ADA1